MQWRTTHTLAIVSLALGLSGAAARGQLAIASSTIDCGGGSSSGGTFALVGTIGQPDAGAVMTGGAFSISGGYWGADVCRADFNQSGAITVQDIFDFLSAWFAATPSADFNHVNGITVQDIFDFLAAWFGGC